MHDLNAPRHAQPWAVPELSRPSLNELQGPELTESEADSDIDLSDEEQSNVEGGEEEQDSFAYTHGFNPIAFLAAFLKSNDPKAVAQRAKDRQSSLRYLCQRADAALDVQVAFAQLSDLVTEPACHAPNPTD